MSAGDFGENPYPATPEKAKFIAAIPIVALYLQRPYTVDDFRWDIPYLAGYSKDGSRIYIDRDLKPWPFRSYFIIANRFLELHEHMEKSLIDAIHDSEDEVREELLIALDMQDDNDEIYYHCHGVATTVEEEAVKQELGDEGLRSYNRFMKTQIKRAEDERIKRVPRDLDMTPYAGRDRMDVRLRAVMFKCMT